MTMKDKASLPDLPDHMDKEALKSQGHNTTKPAPHQQDQCQLFAISRLYIFWRVTL